MDFSLSAEQQAIVAMVENFAHQEILPNAKQWDKEKIFPLTCYHHAAQLGLAGIYVKQDVGGTGLSRLTAALIFETLAKACIPTSAYLSVHNMVAWLIDSYGNEQQRHRWLPALIKMEKLASICLTEPNAGSDSQAIQTSAILEGDIYRVNGAKAFISCGGTSDIYACTVKTKEEQNHGITCLIIEKGTPGIRFGKAENKLGWHNHPTTMVFFDDCKVPIENRIGQEGDGFKIAMNSLNGGRVNIAACSLGAAKAAFQMARNYTQERHQFGKALQQFQSIQFKLADMLTEIKAAELLTYKAAVSIDEHHTEMPMLCAMAKRYATDVGFRVCDMALQLHGGYGYLEDYGIERFFRDSRVNQILEGTNEIMRLIIAKGIMNSDA